MPKLRTDLSQHLAWILSESKTFPQNLRTFIKQNFQREGKLKYMRTMKTTMSTTENKITFKRLRKNCGPVNEDLFHSSAVAILILGLLCQYPLRP
jgi:hypothetical protein